MLSEVQIKRVEEGMLGAEIRALYFPELVTRYTNPQRMLTWPLPPSAKAAGE